MQNLGAAMRLLDQKDPALSARIQPIFVTVDPVRDTPAVLREFTDAFYPRLLGLTGDPATIAKVAQEYEVYFKAHSSGPGGGYLVDHPRMAYLISPEGKPLALLPVAGPPPDPTSVLAGPRVSVPFETLGLRTLHKTSK